MRTFLRLLPLLAGAVVTTAGASAQDAPRTSDESRRATIQRMLDEILAEKIHRDVPAIASDKTGPAALQRAPSEVDVSRMVAQEAEIHAVVNPTDSNNIVISAIRTSRTQSGLALPIFYSRDFGGTWRVSTFQPKAMGGGDPVFAADADGTLYYSWIELAARSQSRIDEGILWSRSTDGGAVWSRADTIAWSSLTSSQFGGFSGTFSDKEWLATDRSSSPHRGNLYAIYFKIVATGQSQSFAIVVRRKLAGATKFLTEDVPVSDDSFIDMQFPSIGVDHRGDVHGFFFGQRNGDTEHRLWHAVSHDGARTFETPQPVGPIRFPDRSDNVPDHLPQRLGALPQFAVDGSPTSPFKGNLYAVWFSNDLNESGPGTHFDPFHIYFARSTDGGDSWSSPRRVNDDVEAVGVDHVYPSIDVSPSGTVVLTWYDGRQSPGNSEVHHYMACSFDGGASLRPNIRVSSEPSSGAASIVGSFGIGDYTKCLSTSGYAIPIWVDGRRNDGDLDVYAAFVPLSTSATESDIRRELVTSVRIVAAPSPASAASVVSLSLRRAGTMRVELVDMLGSVVATIADRRFDAGEHRLSLDCSTIVPGHYLVRAAGEAGMAATTLEIVR